MSERQGPSEAAAPLLLRRMQAEIHLDSARILRGMERRVIRLFEEEGITDLTPAQGNVLMVLFHQRGATKARHLAQELNVSEVTMGRFIAALEASGWIERQQDPEDARARLVSPTTRAYECLAALIRVSNRMMDEAFGGFADGDIAAFHQWTKRVITNLEQHGGV